VTKDNLTRLEFQAVAEVCRYWAGRGFESKPDNIRQLKISKFRDAVFAGQGSGALEDVQYEFLADDYRVVNDALKYALRIWPKQKGDEGGVLEWLRHLKIPYTVDVECGKIDIKRPFPCPEDTIERVVDRLKSGHGSPPSEMAAQIVSSRFSSESEPISMETVRAACKLRRQEKRRKSRKPIRPLTMAECLLMSAFFDLMSQTTGNESLVWPTKILDCLAARELSPLVIFYLIKTASNLDRKIFVGDYDMKQVKKLVSGLCTKDTKDIFASLVK
jgi:hypothetical protein